MTQYASHVLLESSFVLLDPAPHMYPYFGQENCLSPFTNKTTDLMREEWLHQSHKNRYISSREERTG